MKSYWEQNSFTHFDYIVVGSGITGLSTAITLAESHPKSRIAILERGILPTGASTRNAGFACYGSAAEIMEDIRILGKAKALDLVRLRKTGLQLLRDRLGDDAIGYEEWGGGEFISHEDDITTDEIASLNHDLLPIFKKEVFVANQSRAVASGFETHQMKYFLENKVEGQIDTGAMMMALIKYAAAKGVITFTGTDVKEISIKNESVSIDTWNHITNDIYAFTCNKVAICTNAFIKKLFPQFDVKPGRGQVLITEPIANLKFKGIYHFDKGYYYFRNVGQRVLFGGGRNMDFEGETTELMSLNNSIQDSLDDYLKRLIIPNTPYQVSQRWSGIMAFGEEKWPILEKVNKQIVVAGRMNGMGIAIGSEIGRQAAMMLTES